MRTGRDPDQWAKEYVAKLNEEEKKQNADVTLSFSQTKLLNKDHIYECTNFFFEIEQQDEDGLGKFGKGKENRPLPIVEMGLFIDKDGIPLGVCINPGNTSEQKTLKPIEQRIISEYGMSKFIVCTDAGLTSKANRKFNTVQDRAFIVTGSIKKLKKELKEWALAPEGWYICEGSKRKKYDISKLLSGDIDDKAKETFKDTVFYKEHWVEQSSFKEKLIITFSLKYQQYQRFIRNEQVERAGKSIDNGTAKVKKYNQNDYRRFVEKTAVTDNGEVADNTLFAIDAQRIEEEEKYDGFYALNTNLDDDPKEIVKINHLPSYTRTDITDDLHEVFGFRTHYQIIPSQNMKKILKSSKDRNLTRKNDKSENPSNRVIPIGLRDFLLLYCQI